MSEQNSRVLEKRENSNSRVSESFQISVEPQDLVSTMLSGVSEISGIFNSTLGHSEKGWQASLVT